MGVGEPDGRRLVSEKLDWRLIDVLIDCPTAAGDSSATTPAIACVVRIVTE